MTHRKPNLEDRRAFARLLALGGSASLLARPSGGDSQLARLSPAPKAPNEAYWARVRAQFAVPAGIAHINAANLCPASLPVLESVFNATDLDHDLSPANRTRMHGIKETTRQLLADDLRVSPKEILITRNTSDSNNLVSNGLDLKPGDEVLILSDNHPSNHLAWREKAKRFGFQVEVIEQMHPHPGPEAVLKTVRDRMRANTRILGFTHLTNTVGDLFPATELCALARANGTLSLVDGAQSFGLMDVDLSLMQPDFYSGSAHKWACGPKEIGVLYVHKDVQSRFWPSVISAYPGATELAARSEGFGQRDEPAILGFGEALRFRATIGRSAIEARALELSGNLIEGLSKIDGVKVWTHPDRTRSHAVVAFQAGNLDPTRLQTALYANEKIVSATRLGTDRPGLRLSPHFYNSPVEIERTLSAIRRYTTRGL